MSTCSHHRIQHSLLLLLLLLLLHPSHHTEASWPVPRLVLHRLPS